MCAERPNRQIGEYCLSNTVCASDKCVRSKCVEPRLMNLQQDDLVPIEGACKQNSECESGYCASYFWNPDDPRQN